MGRKRMTKCILLLLAVLFSWTAEAKYTQTCKVKYRKNYGWSEYYQVDVNFLCGSELNKATRTYNYSSYMTYAVIFWDKNQATVIEISSYTGCGSTVTKSCITNNLSNLEGEDQKGRIWEICTGNFCY